MKYGKEIRWLLVLLTILFLGCSGTRANSKQERRAAYVLFGQFETVFQAEGPLLASFPRPYGGLAEEDANLLRHPFWYLLAGFDALGQGKAVKVLQHAGVALVGAKDFRGPGKVLNPVRSQVCYVVVLRKGSAMDLRNYFSTAHIVTAARMPVFTWSAHIGEFGDRDPKPTSFYASQIAQAYLLVSNNLEELQRVADQLISSGENSLSFSEIRDWDFVSQYKTWGYRRYRHTGIADKLAAGITDVAPSAHALIFIVDWKGQSFSLRLHTTPEDGTTAERLGQRAALLRLNPGDPGVWDTTFAFVGSKGDTFNRLFTVMYLFGFGVYV